MKHSTLFIVFFGLPFICLADKKQIISSEKYQPALSEVKEGVKEKEKPEIKPSDKINYIPPFLDAPSTDRLHGMGVRNQKKQTDNLLFSALTPAYMGVTSQPQPKLFWFTSRPIAKSFQFIEFVLNSEESLTPILRIRLSLLEKSGIHHLNTQDYNISLKPGIEYSWSIALVKNPKARSMDFVSSNKIKFVKPDEELQQKLQQALIEQKASIYAQAGYWYEALAIAIQQQKEQPDNLTDLINQVELQEIADFIIKHR